MGGAPSPGSTLGSILGSILGPPLGSTLGPLGPTLDIAWRSFPTGPTLSRRAPSDRAISRLRARAGAASSAPPSGTEHGRPGSCTSRVGPWRWRLIKRWPRGDGYRRAANPQP